MGLLKLRAGLYNPEKPERVVEVEAIVDTGAIYSVVRRDILEQLGVKPVERRRFRAFGGYVERDIGEIGIVLMGRRRNCSGDLLRGQEPGGCRRDSA
jgi:predicted aspartyl protease